MSAQVIRKVVIAGGGTAGWVAATALARKLGAMVEITLIESDEIGTVGVGEASIPPMHVFHKLLNIDEQEFMRATSATFKLGISFENWGQRGDHYIHSFGRTGKETWMADFHHFWLHAKAQGYAADFGDYCYELQAAKAGKCAVGGDSELNYAYHLDATAYARFLRRLSEAAGVVRIEGKIVEVQQHPDSGFIQALCLASGQLIEGDFFIDCSGFRGLLIEQTLHSGYEDWSHWLPCDSAQAVQTEAVTAPLPYTRSIAHEAGWQWQIPLQHRVGNGLVYCSKYLGDEQAKSLLLGEVSGKPLSDPRLIKFRTGHRRKVWNKNCVALGLASGFIEPLESTSIHLVMMGVTRLLHQFPFGGIEQSQVHHYNRLSLAEMERIRDFIVLHYKATARTDSPFWRYCKDMEIPASLAQRIELFRRTGQAYQLDGELFRVDSWVQVMLGQGIVPQDYHQIVKLMGDRELQQFLEKMQRSISAMVERLPTHQACIERYCGMAETMTAAF